MSDAGRESDGATPSGESNRGAMLRPQDIETPEDYWEYVHQRLGDRVPTTPTVRVPRATLADVMQLVLGLLVEDEGGYNELQIFEIECGDYVFTSHFDTPTAGDRASSFFSANASTVDQRAFAKAYGNTVIKLHEIHQQWAALGKPIRPTSHRK